MRIILTLISLLFVVQAQPSKDTEIRSFSAVKLSQPIIIDGQMESAWNNAPKQNSFIQEEPNPLEPASKETEFKFLYDDENIYFFIRVHDDKNEIITQTGRRDNAFWNGDWVLIYLDPQHDKTTGFRFGINPSNVQHDARLYNDGWDDDRWDAIWYSQTSEWEGGWQTEVRIPLRAIKFQEKDVQTWGLNVERYMRRKNENSYWEKVDPNNGFKVSRLGTITNLSGLKSQNEINIIPAGVGIFDSEKEYDPSTSDRALGFDVRYNFDAQHSVLATFHPDFSQIEADQDQINISDYPLFFSERRPFFLEGDDLYSMPDEVYYSRNMTKPEYGFKFFGNAGNLKYGLTAVNNDGLAFDDNDNRIDNTEYFLIPRVKYETKELQVGYFGGYKDSEQSRSGKLHAFDGTYRPNDQWRFVSMFATTDMRELNESNYSVRFQTDYNSDTWGGQVKLQKKTNHFVQGLIGFPEENNKTEGYVWLQRKWRFEGGDLRTIRLNYNLNHNGTFDNKVQRNNMNINGNASFQSEKLGYYGMGGGIWMSRGDFRQYNNPDSSKYVAYTENDTRHFDNYGYFQGFTDNTSGWWLWAETDFSNEFAGAINYNYDNFKTSLATSLYLTFQYKPTNDLKFRLQYNYTDIAESRFYDAAFYPSANIRTEYSILPNLFVKWFTQYNGQSRRLSNNVIFTFEYIRGSFIYFAYNEVGEILRNNNGFSNGTLLKNYDLGRRTFSVKWTYSYFL